MLLMDAPQMAIQPRYSLVQQREVDLDSSGDAHQLALVDAYLKGHHLSDDRVVAGDQDRSTEVVIGAGEAFDDAPGIRTSRLFLAGSDWNPQVRTTACYLGRLATRKPVKL